MSGREFDIVVFGASGFTGRLVAEYLATRGPRAWAIAGRNADKLRAIGITAPIVVADALDRQACANVARRTRVVCTTAGPFSKVGNALVAACAEAGTHYCDLTGEVHWMRAMIDAHDARAKQTGARLVFACGFDSIPSDVGTWATQQAFAARFGHPATRVTALFGEQSGGFSGGTVASGLAIAEAAADPGVRRMLGDPYALDPEPPPAPRKRERPIGWNKDLRLFTAPFLMAGSNGPVVRRAHALAGYPWGRDFEYREVMSTPGNPRGLAMALGITAGLGALSAILRRPRLRALLEARAPKPGEGPSAHARERGHWKTRFVAEHGDERLIYVAGDPHGDPGYRSTSKMLGESALCLAYDELPVGAGALTPSTAMGAALLSRLRAAGLVFTPASGEVS